MAKVNTYGINIKGLKAASGSTRNYSDRSFYDELFYDLKTGEVWTVFQCSLGCNTWTEYHDPNVTRICNTASHMTMQEIADAIHEAVCGMQRYA